LVPPLLLLHHSIDRVPLAVTDRSRPQVRVSSRVQSVLMLLVRGASTFGPSGSELRAIYGAGMLATFGGRQMDRLVDDATWGWGTRSCITWTSNRDQALRCFVPLKL
jgi:hypothetical protein